MIYNCDGFKGRLWILSCEFMLKFFHANTFLAFNLIIFKNAADTRICKLAFLWMLYMYYTRFRPYE